MRNTQENYSRYQGTKTITRWKCPNWSHVCFIILLYNKDLLVRVYLSIAGQMPFNENPVQLRFNIFESLFFCLKDEDLVNFLCVSQVPKIGTVCWWLSTPRYTSCFQDVSCSFLDYISWVRSSRQDCLILLPGLLVGLPPTVKSVYCHPAYLTYTQRTSWKILCWMKHKLESRLLGEISITSDVIVFGDRDLGTGVNEKKDTGNPSLKWNMGSLFAEMHAYISSIKGLLSR